MFHPRAAPRADTSSVSGRHSPLPARRPRAAFLPPPPPAFLPAFPPPPRPAVGLGPPSPSRAPLYPLQQRNRWGCISTKLNQRGLASIDRNNKTTLLFTAPSDITKSYAKVLSPRMVKLRDVSERCRLSLQHRCQPAKIQGQRPIRIRLRCVGGNRRFLAWILT